MNSILYLFFIFVCLLCYQELRKIKLDLLAMDHQVDVDKEQIQAKIIKVQLRLL